MGHLEIRMEKLGNQTTKDNKGLPAQWAIHLDHPAYKIHQKSKQRKVKILLSRTRIVILIPMLMTMLVLGSFPTLT